MKSHYRAVVIGGGVVGASVLYHLTKLGWSDVALIERSELTAGSTWHAAAGFHALNADPNIAALQAYTVDLYPKIEQESGQSCGLHMTGGIVIASDPARWEQLKAAWATFRAIGVDEARLIDAAEVRDLTGGAIRTDDILGALWDPSEGYLDPNGTTHAYARAARNAGAQVILRNRVIELHPTDDGWQIVTEQGTIQAEHVVNAAGLWAKQVGRMAGVDLPVTPMEHHYLVTEDFAPVAALATELPVIADPVGFTYARQEGKGLLLGVYEQNPKHWNMDGAPWDFGMELIAPDIDRIADELAIGFARYPGLDQIGIKRWVNGAFTFAPDGNPLVGPIGPRSYWSACGVMAGFSQGGGVGKALAEWMVTGAPQQDVFGMDVARFGPHQSNRRYIRETTGQFYARRFVVTYPNEQLPAGRPLRTSGAHQAMTENGARWGSLWGLETPLYFAPRDFTEPGTMRRSAAFDIVGDECRAVQSAAGLLDITGYARYRVTGKGARGFLDRLLASRLPEQGQVRLAPMLAENGRLAGDLTCLNWGDEYWLMGSYYLRAFHMRWFQQHLPDDAQVEDISDTIGGFALHGPNARAILDTLAESSLDNLTMMRCTQADLGLLRTRIARMSLTGEPGFEINCHASEHGTLHKMLLQASKAHGLKEIGFTAMNALRLEKGIGIWNAEFTQGRTPAMTGLDTWVAWDKGDFIGRDAARKAPPPSQVLALLDIQATDADALGFEPVWQNGAIVGMTTSGGYGHRTGQSLAFALLDTKAAQPDQELDVHITGEPHKAKVLPAIPYDPTGQRARM